MRLLCVTSAYWPAVKFGGPIFSLHNINKVLVKRGVDVTVYCTDAGLEGKVPLNQEVDVDGVKVYYFKFAKAFEFLGSTGWQFSLPLTRALRDNMVSFDLVNIEVIWTYPMMVCAYYCRKYGKPYVIVPRGSLFPISSRGKWWKKFPYFQLITKRDVRGAAAIHFTTKIEAEQAAWVGDLSNRARVIPNGITVPSNAVKELASTLESKYPQLKNKRILLFLGRINWIKGLDLLVNAFSILCREVGNLHLVIAGSDDGDGYADTVIGWINDLSLNEKVTFTGSLSGAEKAAAFLCADIFALPSYSENFANAAAEAMSYGVPVVISNKVGICRDVQEHKAGVVVETNIESLCSGIRCLLNDVELAHQTGMNGKKIVAEFYDINKVADMNIAAYTALVNTVVRK